MVAEERPPESDAVCGTRRWRRRRTEQAVGCDLMDCPHPLPTDLGHPCRGDAELGGGPTGGRSAATTGSRLGCLRRPNARNGGGFLPAFPKSCGKAQLHREMLQRVPPVCASGIRSVHQGSADGDDQRD